MRGLYGGAIATQPGCRVTILADRGFGDQKLFAFLSELGFGYVVRFRGNIHVAAEDGEIRDRIWKSWQRVCRDVAAEAAAAKPKRVPPSRISSEWQPTVVPPNAVSPIPKPPVSSAAVGPETPDPRIDHTLPPHAQASLRRLFKDFDDVANSRLKF